MSNVEDLPSGAAADPQPHTRPSENAANSDEPKPRLAIQRLRLENFKSYGGIVDVGPFHKSFSSIVGPNGSGKSNVIDAMLFIFGRRAKQLRHSKLSELLHHSNTYPNVQSATVTVYFHEIVDTGDGDNDYTIVPGSQFAVARRAFRNNTSKYYLNDREVKMAEVVQLLKAKGVDLDNNRFLILQGEVEQIAMMKPKAQTAHEDGLLEYLEDIIGSNRHISAIEETAKQVEQLNEERGHKMNRVKAAEKERDALEESKLEAEDYLDKERDLLSKKIKLGQAIQFDRKSTLNAQGEKLAQAEEKYNSFQVEVKEKEQAMKELEKTFNETQRECDIAVKTMNEAKDQYTVFERKDIQLRENIKALKTKEKKLDSILKRENKRAEESTSKASTSLEEKEQAETELQELESSLEKAEQALDQIRDDVKKKTAPIRQKLEEKQTELLPFSEKVNQCRKDLQVKQSELQLLIKKLEAPQKNLEESMQSLDEMETNLTSANDSLTELETEAVEVNKAVKDQNDQIRNKKTSIDNLNSSCSSMRRRIEDAKSASDEMNTRSRLHSGILAASRNGVLQGVIGRLGDLASVDSKYSTAVSAAAASRLDNIVVRTAENAQACIQFLRRENLGRATFIILEKIGYLQSGISNWSRSDRGADGPRLFDFLRIPNADNATPLYYALRDTLVADSLEEARRMAFKPTRQNRVVTLGGELIESSGAMTGGGRGPTRYKLGSGNAVEAQMDPGALQDLVGKLEFERGKISQERESLRQLETLNRTSVARLEELQVLITKKVLEVRSLQSRIEYMRDTTLPSLRKVVDDAKRNAKQKACPDLKRKAQLEESVAEFEESLNSARNACQDLESEISSLQDKIVAAGGKKLQDAKDKVEKHRSEISELQSSVSKASSQASAAEKASEKAKDAALVAEQEIEATRQSITEGREQLNSMDEDAQRVLEKYKETEGIHDEWVQKVQQVQSEYTEVKNALKALRREEVSLADAVDEVKRLVSQIKHEIKGLAKQEMSMKKKLARLSLVCVDAAKAVDGDGDDGTQEQETADDEDGNEMEIDSNEEVGLSREEQEQLSAEISVLESDLSKLSPNMSAIAEYQSKDGEYKTQVNELDALTANRDAARRNCDSLRKARLDEFMEGFSIITLKLKELYQMITLGGDAELELVDSLDPFSEGIVFSVRPPKKSWKNISNLSGGEKTLSSLALVFALHHFKPTPLYFLDEIDAALDYKNVSIVANYVKDRTKNAQFIIISLRNNMFELADRLVGIYKTHNTTKSVTIDPSAFVIPTHQDPNVLA